MRTHLLASLLLLAACPGSDPPSTDPDAGAAVPPDAQTCVGPGASMIPITVVDCGEPIEGATVFASDAQGALCGIALTDADGRAQLAVPAGGMVSAQLRWQSAANLLFTVSDVQPGDAITIGDPNPLALPIAAPMIVTFTPPPAATSYVIATPCPQVTGPNQRLPGMEASGYPLVFTEPCVAGGPHRVAVLAFDPDARPVGYLLDPAVDYVAGATIDLGGDWQPTGTCEVSVTGLDFASGLVGIVRPVLDGAAQQMTFGASASPVGGVATFEDGCVPGFADAHQISIGGYDASGGLRIARVDPVAGSHALTAADGLGAPMELARSGGQVSWTPGAGDAPDVTYVWLFDGDDSWGLARPGDATDAIFPELPEGLDNEDLRTAPGVTLLVQVTETELIDDWAEVRARSLMLPSDTARFTGVRLRERWTTVVP